MPSRSTGSIMPFFRRDFNILYCLKHGNFKKCKFRPTTGVMRRERMVDNIFMGGLRTKTPGSLEIFVNDFDD